MEEKSEAKKGSYTMSGPSTVNQGHGGIGETEL